jgi:arginase
VLSIDLVTVPYDSGRRGFRMGAGPQALLRAGLLQQLRAAGYEAELVPVEATGATRDELSTAFDLAGKVARVTRASRAAGRFPLTLSGSCFSTVGAFASVAGDGTGLLWLDAHGDVNTPETSASGFLDGMAAATLLGWCHAERAREILPAALEESRLMLAGTRSLDAPESAALQQSAVGTLSPADLKDSGATAAALDTFTAGLRSLYLHVDADVLDPHQVGRANSFASPGGLTTLEVIDLVKAAGRRARIEGMTVSAYDPAEDTDTAVGGAVIEIITAALTAAAGPASGDMPVTD